MVHPFSHPIVAVHDARWMCLSASFIRNVLIYGPWTGVSDMCNTDDSGMQGGGFRAEGGSGKRDKTRFSERHRRRATIPEPLSKTRLILHFLAGINQEMSPFSHPGRGNPTVKRVTERCTPRGYTRLIWQ